MVASLVSDYTRLQEFHQGPQVIGETLTSQDLDYSAAASSQASLSGEDLQRDLDLLDNEDLMPDQPTFVGLFCPQLFKSLLHKAKTTTQHGTVQTAPVTATGLDNPVDLLFAEPTIELEEIPAPRLFLDIVHRQWTSPGSGRSPSGLDRCLYNMGTDLGKLLQVPTVDAPVVALSLQSVLTESLEENFHPEDKQSEQSLVKANQAAAWAVKASTAAPFFNRASLLWLR